MPFSQIPELKEDTLDLTGELFDTLEALTLAIAHRQGGDMPGIVMGFGLAVQGVGAAFMAEGRAALRHKEDLRQRPYTEWLDLIQDTGRVVAEGNGITQEYEVFLDHLQKHRPPFPLKEPGVS